MCVCVCVCVCVCEVGEGEGGRWGGGREEDMVVLDIIVDDHLP